MTLLSAFVTREILGRKRERSDLEDDRARRTINDDESLAPSAIVTYVLNWGAQQRQPRQRGGSPWERDSPKITRECLFAIFRDSSLLPVSSSPSLKPQFCFELCVRFALSTSSVYNEVYNEDWKLKIHSVSHLAVEPESNWIYHSSSFSFTNENENPRLARPDSGSIGKWKTLLKNFKPQETDQSVCLTIEVLTSGLTSRNLLVERTLSGLKFKLGRDNEKGKKKKQNKREHDVGSLIRLFLRARASSRQKIYSRLGAPPTSGLPGDR